MPAQLYCGPVWSDNAPQCSRMLHHDKMLWCGLHTTALDCWNVCGGHSQCSGVVTSPPKYTCSCQAGYASATGSNCSLSCVTTPTCGSNSICTDGICVCADGFVSTSSDGANCVSPPSCSGSACSVFDPWTVNPLLYGSGFAAGSGVSCNSLGLTIIDCVLPATTSML